MRSLEVKSGALGVRNGDPPRFVRVVAKQGVEFIDDDDERCRRHFGGSIFYQRIGAEAERAERTRAIGAVVY